MKQAIPISRQSYIRLPNASFQTLPSDRITSLQLNLTIIAMVADNEFKGWAGLDEKACDGHMSFQEFAPKKWDEDDVDGKFRLLKQRDRQS